MNNYIESKKIYFKGLHGIRFFCALLVILYHCNNALKQVSPTLYSSLNILKKGSRAVDYFFILSGFLIMYLALNEIEKQGSFNIKRFLKKRIIRIFPLYYLAVAIGFLLIGYLYPKLYGEEVFKFTLIEGLFKYIVFLPNLMATQYAEVGPLRSLWSIGVEEQFYILFSFLLLCAKKNKIIIFLFAFSTTLSIYFLVQWNMISTSESLYIFITKYFRFHFILFGCILGSIFKSKQTTIKNSMLQSKWVQFSIWVIFISLLFLPNSFDQHNIISSFVLGLIILSLSADISLVSLEQKQLSYLGIISYGLYIYHPYVSISLRYFMSKFDNLNKLILTYSSIFYILVLIITIFISNISYKYYESYFFRYKK